ncbi:MAG: ImmA/IrrE family metallo-endopeptidase [Oryzomonas sp.]|uniref:ImmA/IrrE family metallo-endopeptidase n=1 Tax=Oryzomonas sp. TaxID=2855186 RepID=UPI00283D742B|nr:ImmA/IrrE family metallo-endopeptidase [Oryzomonas sp.]MDR3579202.1 ImmA/IrrE family metallo-endopeptidase [Oryzomonas sp.]
MRRLTPAEELLQSLGVTEPGEIDLEAIAWIRGVTVKFQSLDGCEARILGVGDSAIVTVNNQCSFGRQRFSLAHELGHWHFHRGQVMVCRSDEIENFRSNGSPAEKHADTYAVNLLMPRYLFLPALRTYRQIDFDAIRKLGDDFGVSTTAAAIRCVETGDIPAFIICHNQQGRCWFSRSPMIPDRWFPRKDLQAESSARDVLFDTKKSITTSQMTYVSAEAWFDHRDAQRYEVLEQTFRVGPSEILTLLVFEDEKMLED